MKTNTMQDVQNGVVLIKCEYLFYFLMVDIKTVVCV